VSVGKTDDLAEIVWIDLAEEARDGQRVSRVPDVVDDYDVEWSKSRQS
jgi:hypothetical protein